MPIADRVNMVLDEEHAAFRLVGGDTFVPVGSAAEAAVLNQALLDSESGRLPGAHTHLRRSAEQLTVGRFADSVRESIHAVEAAARAMEPSAELSKALAKLEASAGLHGAMRKGFAALYGYASDEEGIRHPLLDQGDANVDEADAMFMLGACAAFVSYLISKGRAAGLITG